MGWLKYLKTLPTTEVAELEATFSIRKTTDLILEFFLDDIYEKAEIIYSNLK